MANERAWRRRLTVLGVVAVGATTAGVLTASTANGDPTAQTWFRLRMCESSNNYQINTGNGYYGAYQFDLPTWQSVGGRGLPNLASPAEQDARALMLYRMRGWEPWTCATLLGLSADSDAGSGRTGDIRLPAAHPASRPTPAPRPAPAPRPTPSPAPAPAPQGNSTLAPPWPGPQYFSIGDHDSTIARWQKQMKLRGAPFVGTGQFGPKTLAVVKRIQGQNGIPQTGLLGPVTWRLAWEGRYVNSAPATVQAPPWPGPQYFSIGDHHTTIARWQKQMRLRGAPFVGTGQFGPNTLAVVKQIQRQNGIPQTGLLGPVTWRLAWMGHYTP